MAYPAPMSTRGLAPGLLLLLLTACSSADELGDGGTTAPDAGAPADAAAPPDAGEVADGGAGADAGSPTDAGPAAGQDLDGLVAAVAAETCDLLLRCCDAQAQADYFAPIVAGPRIMDEGFAARVPPMAALDAQSCPTVLGELFAVQPFGPWVTAAQAGLADYDATAAGACLETMRNAACGEEARAALFDGTCLAFSPPAGGDVQRTMFDRTTGVDGACQTLTDGVGGAFFGTCDPTVAFCCVPDPQDPSSCRITEGAGTCRRASQVGEPCSIVPELRVCATGLFCGDMTCEAPVEVDLALGDPCFDGDTFATLGTCIDSWCDSLGTNRCEARLPLDAACTSAAACDSGACIDGRCQEPTLCERP